MKHPDDLIAVLRQGQPAKYLFFGGHHNPKGSVSKSNRSGDDVSAFQPSDRGLT